MTFISKFYLGKFVMHEKGNNYIYKKREKSGLKIKAINNLYNISNIDTNCSDFLRKRNSRFAPKYLYS